MAVITISIDSNTHTDVMDLVTAVESVARLITSQTVVRSNMHANTDLVDAAMDARYSDLADYVNAQLAEDGHTNRLAFVAEAEL